MKRIILTVLFLPLMINLFAQNQCDIKGEVIGRDSKVLLLRKCSEGFKSFLNKPTKISIKNGKFNLRNA